MFVKLLTATKLIWTKRNTLDMIRYVLQKSFPWEIRKHIQGFREQKQQIHFKEMKYFLSLSLSLGSPWSRLCSWAGFMLESCPKYALTEGPWGWTQSCLLSHTCHHTRSQVLNCLRTLSKESSSLFLKYSLVKMNVDAYA